jgi:SAM-dependent methyltransferase
MREIYENIVKEYNETALAKKGWECIPTEFGLIEIETIKRYLPSNKMKLLDIGTGKGIAPRVFDSLGYSVFTVDSKKASGTSAIENIKSTDISGYYCDVEKEGLPFEDGTFDLVFFGDVIEHLLHSPKKILSEIHRVLKKGGVCVATTPNSVRLTARLKLLIGHSNWANIDEYFDLGYHSGHHHEYTLDEFTNAFIKTKFSIKEKIMYEDSLRNVKLYGLESVKTQERGCLKNKKEKLYWVLVKSVLLVLTSINPKLRSNMLIVSKKEY